MYQNIARPRVDDLVSVVMPTYMQVGFLKEAIDSVLNQTYANFELIIIDNYSTDGTDQLVRSYHDSRVRYYKFRNAGIIAASRNYGIDLANGNYVAFLDSDDIWLPQKLECSLKALASGSDFVCHNMRYFNSKGMFYTPTGPSPDVASDPMKSLLRLGNFINTSTVVTRKDLLDGGFCISPDIVTAEDYDLWLTIFSRQDCRCTYLSEDLTYYRIHGASNSSQAEKHAAATLAVISKWSSLTAMGSEQFRRLKSIVLRSVGRSLFNKGQRWNALRFCARSLFADISSVKSWLFLFSFLFPTSTVAFIQNRARS